MVVGPGEAVKAGGFLTGWRGIAIFISMIATAAVLAVTGIQAERNTFPRLSVAESEFNGGDYGLGALYAPCITNGSFIGQQWVFDIPVPGTNRFVETVSLGDRRLLSDLTDGDISPSLRWKNNPEFVCFVICRLALGDDCTYFTYDGLDADSCRFGAPDFPMKEIQPSAPEDFLFVYNATCMQRRREQLVAPIEAEATDLERPGGRAALGSVAEAERLQESILDNVQFMRGQWAGPLPADYVNRGGYPWREPGFLTLGQGCPEEDIVGSFATGDHVIVTMATANQVAVMSMALTWWKNTIGQLGGREVRADRDEILRGAAYLISAWDPSAGAAGRLLLGVGDQLNINGVPELYSDFGSAVDALQIGEPPFENGQASPVDPDCTYTKNDRPEPATAAQAAAALALGSVAVAELSAGGPVTPATMQEVAMELYESSIVDMPIAGQAQFPEFNASTEYGASQLYPLDKDSPLQVRSHQLFAACTLFQATGELRYWNDTLTLYDLYFDALDQDLLDSPLYNPSANYRNPQWYALLCMAQSAPDASNIADAPLLAVPEHVDPSAESAGNETAAGWRAGQRAQYRQYLAAQLPETGTRMEVMRQISNNFVYPWLTLESRGSDGDFAQNDRLRASTPDSFHYFDLNGGDDDDPVGSATVIRDAANAALVSLIWADLPGVNEEQAFQARCMAKQQVDFVLGENSAETSLQGEFGEGNSVRNFWHKDSACPDEDTRAELFSPVGAPIEGFNETAPNPGPRVEFSTRRCDFMTMFGNQTDISFNKDLVEFFGDDAPEVLDPVLPNFNLLAGAVAATFDVTGANEGLILNQRALCKSGEMDVTTCPRANQQNPNPMTQVSIDTNAAFFGAVTGVAALPAAFWDRVDDCPAPEDRVAAAQRVRDAEIKAQKDAEDANFIKEATADPNLTVPGPDNGLRVPRRAGTPAPVDDEDLVEEAAPEGDAEAEDEGRR